MTDAVSPSSRPNHGVERLIATMFDELATAIAILRVKGYTEVSYDKLEQQFFLSLTEALKRQGLTRKAAAGMLGKSPRAFFESLRRNGDEFQTPEPAPLYWEILLYIHDHQEGVTQRDLLAHFGPTAEENRILATIEALRRAQHVSESGARGADATYFARVADLPDHDLSTIEPGWRDHMRAVAKAFVASCEKTVLGHENDVMAHTVSLDSRPDGPSAAKLRELVDEFVAKLRTAWEEATPAGPGERTGRATVYIGHFYSP